MEMARCGWTRPITARTIAYWRRLCGTDRGYDFDDYPLTMIGYRLNERAKEAIWDLSVALEDSPVVPPAVSDAIRRMVSALVLSEIRYSDATDVLWNLYMDGQTKREALKTMAGHLRFVLPDRTNGKG